MELLLSIVNLLLAFLGTYLKTVFLKNSWNWIMPQIFGLPHLNFIQTFSLIFLTYFIRIAVFKPHDLMEEIKKKDEDVLFELVGSIIAESILFLIIYLIHVWFLG